MSKPQPITDFHYDLRARDAIRIILVGALVSSMVFQLFCFAAAAMYGMRVGVAMTIVTAGVTYLSFLVQIDPRGTLWVGQAFVVLSILCGTVAGAFVVAQLIFG